MNKNKNDVIIKKARKYYDVKLGMNTTYGYVIKSLYQKFLTYDDALNYAKNVALYNDYNLKD